MQKKRIIPIFIVIILVVAVVLVLLLMPATNIYKVSVQGTVGYGFAGIGGWSVSVTKKSTIGDNYFPISTTIFDTGNIKVIATLTGGSNFYRSETSVGTLSSIVGGSVNYNIDIRQVPKGTYNLHIEVYEVSYTYGIPLLGEESKKLVKSIDQTNVGIPTI